MILLTGGQDEPSILEQKHVPWLHDPEVARECGIVGNDDRAIAIRAQTHHVVRARLSLSTMQVEIPLGRLLLRFGHGVGAPDLLAASKEEKNGHDHESQWHRL